MIWTGTVGVADIGERIMVGEKLSTVLGYAMKDGTECYVVDDGDGMFCRLVPETEVTAKYVKVEL